jgi:ABC-type sugar transport system substrate-binding protein
MTTLKTRWLPLAAILALILSTTLAACGSSGSSSSSSSSPGTSESSENATGESAPLEKDEKKVNELINLVYGTPIPQSELPPVVVEALKVAAVEMTPAQLEKVKSCIGQTVCETGNPGGTLTIGNPIDDQANPINLASQIVTLTQLIKYPNVAKVLMPSGQGDIQRIISNFRSMVSQGASMIISNYGNGESMGTVAKQAQDQGTLIVALSQGPAGIEPGEDYIFVGNDLCEYGTETAEAVIKESGIKTGGSVALMTGVPGNPYYAGWNGCAKEVFEKANWNVVYEGTTNWTPQGAAQATSALIASGKQVDAIAYDADCYNVAKTYLDGGQTPPPIIAAGVSPACLGIWEQAKKEGKEFKGATGNPQVFDYLVGVTAGMDRLAGKEVPSNIKLVLPYTSFEALAKNEPEFGKYPATATFESPLSLELKEQILGGS